MPYYTDKEIEQRKAAGVKMNKLNCGWNLPTEIIAEIIPRINALEPKTDTERRNKRILELAFLQDMNPHQIARLNDPLIIGMGNRNHGKPLSPHGIRDICIDFAPEIADYRRNKRTPAAQQRRNELNRNRQTIIADRPKICSTCGSTSDIELHHIIPLAAGGTNDYYNLVYLCHDCHMKLHRSIYDRLQWAK